MKKLTLDPPRTITRNQLIAKRASLHELERKQFAYYQHSLEFASPSHPDVLAAHEQWAGTRGQRRLLDELLGGAA